MSSKKIVIYQIGRLKDKSVEVRKRAIEELRALADPIALEALEHIYHNDPDATVRQAAREAGLAIFNAQRSSPKP